MNRCLIVIIVLLSLAACGGSPAPTPDVIATQVAQAQAVAATLTAAAAPTATLTPTVTNTPTPTPTPSLTPTPSPTVIPTSTYTPSPTLSPTPRPTLTPTRTRPPTYTPTPFPGVGQTVKCGGAYELTVLREFSIENLVADPPMGVYGRVYFKLTNLQPRTESLLWNDELLVKGKLDGRWVEFEATILGVNYREKSNGWNAWLEDLPPGVPVKMIATFDVNPKATDWVFVLAPKELLDPICEVEVLLSRSGAPTSVPGSGPTATSKPAPQPTRTQAPTPAMQLLADSQADFTGSQGQNSWEYLFSEGRDTFNWKQMDFDGSCWRGPFENEQVRICPDHGAPGAKGDIAWLYKAETSGKLVFKVTAKKTEAQGDDIEIRVYRHTNLLDTWYLDEGETQGFTRQFELDANGGEMFFFTMQVSSTWREFKYDPTVFRVQVYVKQ
jgi:hypothetical protein